MIDNLVGIKGSDNQDNQKSMKYNQSHCGQSGEQPQINQFQVIS